MGASVWGADFGRPSPFFIPLVFESLIAPQCMRFIDSTSPDYAKVTDYAKRRTPTDLVREVDDPSPSRFAAISGPLHRPRSIAIISAYTASDLVQRGSVLGLWLVDANGDDYTGTLADITGGEPFLHLELVESFDRKRGHLRSLIESLSDAHLLASPTPDGIGAYERFGFEAIDICNSIPGQHLYLRRP